MKRLLCWSILAGLFLPSTGFATGFIINGGTVTLANQAQIASVSDLVINSGALVANQSNIILQGNWTNNGTFTAGTSTVTLTGSAGQTVYNNNQAFSILIDSNTTGAGVTFSTGFMATGFTINSAGLASSATVYFNPGSTYTITNIGWVGASGKMVWLRSTSNNNPWFLNNTSTNTVAWTDVRDSNAASGKTIAAGPRSVDSGNNVNWTFLILAVTISPHNYDFGTVDLGGTTVSTSAITVTNGGNDTETFSLSVATSGAKTVWGVGTSTPTSNDTFVLFGGFNGVMPSSGTFGIQDVITSTPTASSNSVYAIGQTGVSVPVTNARQLWMFLNMPLSTSTTDQEQLNATVTAGSP